MLRLAQGVCVQDAWESAICTPYPLGYVVVLIRSRSPTTTVVPPSDEWALFGSTSPSQRREGDRVERRQAAGCRDRQLNGRVVNPDGVVVINSVQFVSVSRRAILTPITRGP